jgi:hypothetical protein
LYIFLKFLDSKGNHMLVVIAIYDGKQVKFLKNLSTTRPTKIIVIYLEDELQSDDVDVRDAEESTPLGLFDDLIGIITENKNGSVNQDKYIYSKENL